MYTCIHVYMVQGFHPPLRYPMESPPWYPTPHPLDLHDMRPATRPTPRPCGVEHPAYHAPPHGVEPVVP